MINERDPLRQAELILEEGKDKYFSVKLPVKTMRLLNYRLYMRRSTIKTVYPEGEPSGETHEENLSSVLFSKTREAIVTDPQTGLRIKKGMTLPDKISIAFSEREIDFLNNLLLHEIQVGRISSEFDELLQKMYPDRYDEMIISNMREANLSMFADTMAIFRELNTAFIKAGGPPRQEFTTLYDNYSFSEGEPQEEEK